MKRSFAALLCCLMLLTAAAASACGSYVLIWDSSDRLLFEEEVRGYHWDTLGYVHNEILARHGYHFLPGSRYKAHFEYIGYVDLHDVGFPYEEAPESVTNEEILAGLSDIERQNIELITRIRREKYDDHDNSGFFASWTCDDGDGPCVPFVGEPSWVNMPINLRLPVYSGPGEDYLRGDDGCAFAPSDDLLAYGFDGDWLMITYIVDPDRLQRRVGYVHKDTFRRELNHPECASTEIGYLQHNLILPLDFTAAPRTLAEDTVLTDDPMSTLNPLASLKRGETVTLLATFMQEKDIRGAVTDWAYVEYVGEQPMRGFVPLQALR